MDNPIKMDDFWVPLFLETSILIIYSFVLLLIDYVLFFPQVKRLAFGATSNAGEASHLSTTGTVYYCRWM